MQRKLDKVNEKLKSTWISLFKICVFVGAILAIFYFFMGKGIENYIAEYESTTWYEAQAELQDSESYTVSETRTRKRAGKKEKYTVREKYYTWHYVYAGKDGKQYRYSVDGNSSEGEIGDIITIYVDENDASHSLEIMDIANEKKENLLIIFLGTAIIIGPCVLAAIIITMVLLARRGMIVQEMKRQEKRYDGVFD